MNDQAHDFALKAPASFGRRLKRIQKIRDPREKARRLKRLLELFGAQEVHCNGAVVGYRLPAGEWFCRKIAYATHEDAHMALRRARLTAGVNLRGAYQCRQCQKWHLTHRLQNNSTNC